MMESTARSFPCAAALLLGGLTLSGCATGAVVADRVMAPVLDRALQRQAVAAEQPVLTLPPAQQQPTAPLATPAQEAPAPSSAVRWLYGSAEGAASSIQAYRALIAFAEDAARDPPDASVPMGLPDAPDGIGAATCLASGGARKPLAVVFDADETVLLNRGHEYWRTFSGQPFTPETWAEWERTGAEQIAPVPGAVTAIRALREAGVTPIYNTNRSVETAQGTVRALAAAGFGDTVVGENLFLRGMDATGGRKDARRARIAERYCVIALVGDNLGDFADAFNEPALGVQERRRMAGRGEYARLWGNGWFVLPNPVYGAFDRGTLEEVFPPDARWQPGITRTAPDIMGE